LEPALSELIGFMNASPRIPPFRTKFARVALRLTAVLTGLALPLAGSIARALELHAERSSPFDLALTGRLAGVPAGASRYVRWADLRKLPTLQVTLDGEFVRGPQTLTVVPLAELWRALPIGAGSDCLLAVCQDGYASVYTTRFILEDRPFLVLAINGQGPDHWPPPGLKFNPGPYVITVSAELAPGVLKYRDLEHKKPWGVISLEVASYADRFHGVFSGRWGALTPQAQAGREIWINSCASCHPGPAGIFGGTKSGRPFAVIAAFAGSDRSFFMRYVRDPKSLVPSATMEPHPRYTDAELDQLIAFITAGTSPGS
jgi:cytochrome c2